MDCKSCENLKWKNLYFTAQDRFDRIIMKMTFAFIIVFVVMLGCLIATICMGYKTQEFIDGFEYVEETEIQIEQDCHGKNTVILGDGSEVVSNGTGIQPEEKEVLEEENNKVNTIHIGK